MAPAAEADYAVESFSSRTTDAAAANDTAAAGHPFQNQTAFEFSSHVSADGSSPHVFPEQELKDAAVTLAPGFLGNPAAVPRCGLGDVEETEAASNCPPGSRVGTIVLSVSGANPDPDGKAVHNSHVPVYNLPPEPGYPAQFGFKVVGIVTALSATLLPRSESYGLTIGSKNAPKVQVVYFDATFCSYGAEGPPESSSCKSPSGTADAPFLSNPLDCSDPQPTWKLAADSWENASTLLPNGFPDLADPAWLTAERHRPTGNRLRQPAPCLPVRRHLDRHQTTAARRWPGPGRSAHGPRRRPRLPPGQRPDRPQPRASTTPCPRPPSPRTSPSSSPPGSASPHPRPTASAPAQTSPQTRQGDQVHYDDTKPVRCPDCLQDRLRRRHLAAARRPRPDQIRRNRRPRTDSRRRLPAQAPPWRPPGRRRQPRRQVPPPDPARKRRAAGSTSSSPAPRSPTRPPAS